MPDYPIDTSNPYPMNGDMIALDPTVGSPGMPTRPVGPPNPNAGEWRDPITGKIDPKRILRSLLENTAFALSQGAAAQAAAPPGQRNQAAFGAAMGAPMVLQRQKHAAALEQARMQLDQANAERAQAQAVAIPQQIQQKLDEAAAKQKQLEHEGELVDFTKPTGETIQIPRKAIPALTAAGMGVEGREKVATIGATSRERVATAQEQATADRMNTQLGDKASQAAIERIFKEKLQGTSLGAAMDRAKVNAAAATQRQAAGIDATAQRDANKAATALAKPGIEANQSVSALEKLASQNTYIADVAMADQFFNVVKPGSGARMNQSYIDRLMQPGPLKNKMAVWAKKLGDGQLLTDEDRKYMIEAARAVASTKQPPSTGTQGSGGRYNPATGKIER